ncbi:MAG: hypothetical protein FJ152_09390 [Firmicutes bacterium]|nr:hypothetical protein [Bacillota bacterium]
MKAITNNGKVLHMLMGGLLVLTLAGCGSTYVDAFNPAIDEFNDALNNFNTQIDVVNDDNSMFTDPQWVAETETTLSVLHGSAQALSTLPEPDSDEYSKLADLTKQLADTTLEAADAFRAAIDSGDINQIDNADPFFDQINSLLPQINAEVGRMNE